MATNPFAEYKWQALFTDWRLFADGLTVTIEVAIVALLVALLLGILFGVAGVFPNKNLRILNRVYVEFFQNTPLVIQVIFLYHVPYTSTGIFYIIKCIFSQIVKNYNSLFIILSIKNSYCRPNNMLIW